MSAKRKPHVERCLNCGASTPGAYCSGCGQEAVDASVSFRDQLADFFSELASFEERLPQTMKLLLTKPGDLTRAYNGGQRVRFVTPLKLYLFTGFVFFLVLSLMPDRSDSMLHIHTSGHSDETRAWLDGPEATGALGRIARRMVRATLENPAGVESAVVDTLSKATIVLVPIQASLLTLLYWRPRRLYAEHVVFSLHVHSFGYIAFAVSTLAGLLPDEAASLVSAAAPVATASYAVLAARKTYAESLGRSFLKMLAAGTGYLFAFALVLAVAASIGALRS